MRRKIKEREERREESKEVLERDRKGEEKEECKIRE